MTAHAYNVRHPKISNYASISITYDNNSNTKMAR